MKKRKILFLTFLLPYPLDSGGKITTFKTIKFLAGIHMVDLACFAWSKKDWQYQEFFKRITNNFVMIDLKRKPLFPYFFINNLARKPHYVYRDFSNEMKTTVENLIKAGNYDYIYIDHLVMASYIPSDFRNQTILEEHNVEAEIMDRYSSLQKSPLKKLFSRLEYKNLKQYELRTCNVMDKIITFTDKDKKTLGELGVDLEKIAVIPPGSKIDKAELCKLNVKTKNIVHIGTAHWPPNVDGILWFAKDIFPKVAKEIPDTNFYIVGKEPPQKIRKLHNGQNIFVFGYVEDIEEIYKKTGVFIVPLRIGSGIRIKILEALAKGLPIVTTSIGCEGIGARDGEHLLIANDPEEFANGIIQFLKIPHLRIKIGKQGRAFVMGNFVFEKRAQSLTRLIT